VTRVPFALLGAVVNLLPCLPFDQAAPKVAFEAGSRLIAVFGPLREHLHNDGRDGARDLLQPLGRDQPR